MVEMQGIEDFWHWWQQEGATLLANAIHSGDFADLPEQMAHLVNAINKDLQWELGPGRDAQHSLCVTANGDPALRPLTERWLRAAPAPDATWEYRAARQADPNVLNQQLDFADWELDLEQTRLSLTVDEQSLLVDVTVHHPQFPNMPEDAALQIAFLTLTWLLGEDDLERWIGEVNTAAEQPADALPADALPETVHAMAARHPEPSWVVMEGEGQDGARLTAIAMRPMRWIDHPLLDLHAGITLRYPTQDPRDLPTSAGLTDLQDLEDDLMRQLDGAALLVAHETGRGNRTLHLYCDSTDTAALATITAWVHGQSTATLDTQSDPAWDQVGHLR
ncbi:DUF695 domain-containing protein [Crossiella sp. CA198]|uniref:DUF695 domain-containing protein n=1 Tax=Crossiella sp. CA198 TaxID=3455607 RepID=UPI003F8D002C